MEKVFNVEDVKSSTYYFHMKTTILADFQICISVPLSHPISGELPIQQSHVQS